MDDGFGSEWATVADRHRVRIDVRCSFPDSRHRELLNVASLLMTRRMSGHARLVRLLDDDRAGIIFLTVASTDGGDRDAGEGLACEAQTVFEGPDGEPRLQVVVNVVIVDRGDESSDWYDHCRHLHEAIERRESEAREWGEREREAAREWHAWREFVGDADPGMGEGRG